jgi:hypothetical protein
MKIIFVGLSNKINLEPLASSTKSGSLIDEVIVRLDYVCIKTNLVNFAPVDTNGKLRYPNLEELEAGFNDLRLIIEKNSPCIVVGLGSIVCKKLDKKVDNLVKIKHPSYVSIYRRSQKDDYVQDSIHEIVKLLKK